MNGMKKVIFYILLITITASCNSGETANTQQPDSTDTRTSSPSPDSVITSTRTIVFFGNSLTAGYGIEPTRAFPALIGRRLDSLGLPYKVVNAGVSGETSSGGNSR